MLKKRIFQAAAAVAAAALILTGCSASGPDATEPDESGVTKIVYGSWQTAAPPVSNMYMYFLEQKPEIQEKYNLNIEHKLYTNLQTLYTDLAQGRVQAVSAGPASMAASAAQGAPIRLAGLVTRSTASIISSGKGWTADELRGSRLVAATGTSTWGQVEAQIRDTLGLAAGPDYELVTAESNGAALTQLAAGTADYAMSWGETTANAQQKFDNIKVVADPETLAGDGKPFWQFSLTVHDSVSEDVAVDLMSAIGEVVDWMVANPDEVEAFAVENEQTPGVALSLLEDGIQKFEVTPMNDSLKAELTSDFEGLIASDRMDKMPPESFWGGSAAD